MENPYRDIEKVVINTGLGRLSAQANFKDKILPEVIKEFALLTGQKPAARIARESIAGFKLRAGSVIGLKATLRGARAEQFLKKLFMVAIPRVRDFRGIPPTSIDGQGNLTLGVKEHIVFPEINPEHMKVNFGLEITIVPSLRDRDRALEFYKVLGIPLQWPKHR